MWALVGRNKRSVVLDPSTTSGVERLQALTRAADVVVANQPPALLEQWRCTPEAIMARHPSAVVATVTCYGWSGPYAERPGAGSMAEAFAGLTHLTGDPTGPPTLTSAPLGDMLAAVSGLVGVLLACYHRDARGGSGQHVDVTMYEPVLTMLGSVIGRWSGDQPVPERTGSRVEGGVPRNVYCASDGRWLVLSGTTDPQVARLLVVMGQDNPEARARYGRASDRLRRADELDGLTASWIAGRSRDKAVAALLDARIPVAPVNDLAAVVADAQVVARRSLVELDDPIAGRVLLPAPTPRLGTTPGMTRSSGPALGQGHDDVLREWLGSAT
jgi:crotonobetainyl-CoA:carnitine CoA-transferase CaiB-like acyl-CoA transferase